MLQVHNSWFSCLVLGWGNSYFYDRLHCIMHHGVSNGIGSPLYLYLFVEDLQNYWNRAE